MNFLKVLYQKEKFIFQQRFEIMRLNKIVGKLDSTINDLKKELEYYKEENFRKDNLKGE